jgi:hypothetical protein
VNRGTSALPVDFRGTHVTYACFPAYVCNSYGLVVSQAFMDASACWWGNCERGAGLRPASYSTCSQDFATCLTAINGYVAPGVTVDTSCPGFIKPDPAPGPQASGPGLCPILDPASSCYCPPEKPGCPGYCDTPDRPGCPGYIPPPCSEEISEGCPGYVPPACPVWLAGCPGYVPPKPSPSPGTGGLSKAAFYGIVGGVAAVVLALAIGLGVHFGGVAKRKRTAAAAAPAPAPAPTPAAPAVPAASAAATATAGQTAA